MSISPPKSRMPRIAEPIRSLALFIVIILSEWNLVAVLLVCLAHTGWARLTVRCAGTGVIFKHPGIQVSGQLCDCFQEQLLFLLLQARRPNLWCKRVGFVDSCRAYAQASPFPAYA